jgi:putative peptide zinc metalloprotease protein
LSELRFRRVVPHQLVIRDSDDDPDVVVVGRAELGEFVELPRVGAEVIRLLDEGMTVSAVEEFLASRHQVQLDVAEFVDDLTELGFVRSIDGRPVADSATDGRGAHLPWLRDRHVRWLFGRAAGTVWLAVALATVVTWYRQPDLLVAAADFYWTPYVGLAVLVNTAMFSVSVTVHELMHLAAARSVGAPARVALATRLHHLVVQTDVTAIWGVPRRQRYRVYVAGVLWDTFVIGVSTLLIAHADLPGLADRLLSALALVVALSLLIQVQVFMRTDLYYVLMEWLRCGNLLPDSLAYAQHLWRRWTRRPTPDPTLELPRRERRVVRCYTVLLVVGSATALGAFAVFGLPILVEGVRLAFSGLVHGIENGDVAHTIDSALVILVEGAVQTAFLVTFYRRHLRRAPAAARRP